MPWHEWILIGVIVVVGAYALRKAFLDFLASGDR